MDDVIKLLTSKYTLDEYGNHVEEIAPRVVYCKVRSVGRTEFYQASQNDMHPSFVFILSHYKDYMGEKDLLYTDWTGREKRFSIVRTYRTGDSIELTAEEKVEDYDGISVGTD